MKFNHVYFLGFTVVSKSPDQPHVDEIWQGLLRKVYLMKANEVKDKTHLIDSVDECENAQDTYEVTEDEYRKWLKGE